MGFPKGDANETEKRVCHVPGRTHGGIPESIRLDLWLKADRRKCKKSGPLSARYRHQRPVIFRLVS